jgi:hypothetical protein
LILSLFSSPSEIISKIQEGSDIGYLEDQENSIFISSFGSIQIVIDDRKNQIEINPIEGKTESGWENLINYIHDEDRKMMTEIIGRLESFGSISAREIMEMDEDEF